MAAMDKRDTAWPGRVRLTVERVTQATPDEIRRAKQVYEGLSQKDIDEIEEIARHRGLFAIARS